MTLKQQLNDAWNKHKLVSAVKRARWNTTTTGHITGEPGSGPCVKRLAKPQRRR